MFCVIQFQNKSVTYNTVTKLYGPIIDMFHLYGYFRYDSMRNVSVCLVNTLEVTHNANSLCTVGILHVTES